MRPTTKAKSTDRRSIADVALPHLLIVTSLGCPFRAKSAMVDPDRTQAVFLLKRGLKGKMSPTFQEYWSRGCLRAHVLFSVFACWPLWLLVRRKKKKSYSLKSRFRPSQPIPANTSNLSRRANWGNLIWHAASLALQPKRQTSINCDLALHQGLLGRLQAMLRTAAVSFTQDRSTC